MRKRALNKIISYFKKLPDRRIDQSEWEYHKYRPCCVGSHLAYVLGAGGNYFAGADAWARSMGGNRAHAILLLRQAGAGDDPFGKSVWQTPPAMVFQRLAEIEKLPVLANANLAGIDMVGADLEGANFNGADLSLANLINCNLTEAYLCDADLIGANLLKANLEGAYLRGANLAGANLRNANLEYAYLRDANLTGVKTWLVQTWKVQICPM